MRRLAPTFPDMGAPWTRNATLPGGDVPATFADWTSSRKNEFAWLAPATVDRFCRAYGTRIGALLAGVKEPADLGRDFGGGLTEREIDYLIANEWAESRRRYPLAPHQAWAAPGSRCQERGCRLRRAGRPACCCLEPGGARLYICPMQADKPRMLDIESRTGWPDDLRFLLDRYPREVWPEHINLGPMARFWLDIHNGFRHHADKLNASAGEFREGLVMPERFPPPSHRACRCS